MNHILKATSKGQITLPAKWRKNFETDQYLVKEKEGKLEITPIDIDTLDDTGEWQTLFSAKRDNKGKGVPIDDFIEALENTF
jgi:bifunctional DNA-binding transcriptional regulator/antitoxin component of YhaV-PrlF toxin-antitoxin module